MVGVVPSPYLHGETVTVVRTTGTTRDALGIEVPAGTEEIPVEGCVVTPRQELDRPGGAQQQGRNTITTGWTVYAPPATRILATDRLLIRGEQCIVNGAAADWGINPLSGTAGPVVINADRFTG